jgi:hypothetical protein
MVMVKPDDQLKDMLPAPPVAARSFPQNDGIALFAEVYDNLGGAPHPVDIVTTLTSDTGQVVYTVDEEYAPSEIAAKYGYTVRMPLNDVAPGVHVLKVQAHSRRGRETTTARQVNALTDDLRRAFSGLILAHEHRSRLQPLRPSRLPRPSISARE